MEVLSGHVRRDTLRTEVRTMRERMRKELSRATESQFDIKQDAGGVADIEFLAQYWALRWAKDYPPVAMFSTTIALPNCSCSRPAIDRTTTSMLPPAGNDTMKVIGPDGNSAARAEKLVAAYTPPRTFNR